MRPLGHAFPRDTAYFVTMRTQRSTSFFGKVVNGERLLSVWTELVREEWSRSPVIRFEIQVYLEDFAVLPSCVRRAVWIPGDERLGATGRIPLPMAPAPQPFAWLIAGIKLAVAKQIRESCRAPGTSVRKGNTFEHILAVEDLLNRTRRNVASNPLWWHFDRNNPEPAGFDELEIWPTEGPVTQPRLGKVRSHAC